MRVTVVTRDGLETVHHSDTIHVGFVEDDSTVVVLEEFMGPSGSSWKRTIYLRESVAKIVEHDYLPGVDSEGEGAK